MLLLSNVTIQACAANRSSWVATLAHVAWSQHAPTKHASLAFTRPCLLRELIVFVHRHTLYDLVSMLTGPCPCRFASCSMSTPIGGRHSPSMRPFWMSQK